jgi:Laminin EGF domain
MPHVFQAGYFNLTSDDIDGCSLCDCDPGGSLSSNGSFDRIMCSPVDGQCPCRDHVSGRTCRQPEAGYFVPVLDYMTFEAEEANFSISGGNVKVIEKRGYL